jgi:hypothetical protein
VDFAVAAVVLAQLGEHISQRQPWSGLIDQRASGFEDQYIRGGLAAVRLFGFSSLLS